MNTNLDARVDEVLGTLSRARWEQCADAGQGAALREQALAHRPISWRRSAAIGLLCAGALAGLGFAAVAILHSFPLSMEVQEGGKTVYSDKLEVKVENGVIAPVTVQTSHGPISIPIDLPPGIKPEQVTGMEMKVEVKFSDDQKPENK